MYTNFIPMVATQSFADTLAKKIQKRFLAAIDRRIDYALNLIALVRKNKFQIYDVSVDTLMQVELDYLALADANQLILDGQDVWSLYWKVRRMDRRYRTTFYAIEDTMNLHALFSEMFKTGK